MYKNNKIYGNNATLNHYIDEPAETPIWGEIQHSLDFNFELLKKVRTPRIVRSFFTWRREDAENGNKYFQKKWVFTDIGDPFLYQCRANSTLPNLTTKSRVLIVPKYQRNESQQVRIINHLSIVEKFKSKNKSNIEVSLHPGETNDDEVSRIYKNAGIKIRDSLSFFDSDYLLHEEKYLSTVAEVHTNYIGPTLLRAVFLGAKGKILSNSSISKELLDLRLFKNGKSMGEEFDFASALLGVNSMKSKEDLKYILSGNVKTNLALQLRKVKFACEKNLINILFSKQVHNVKILCTKCISMNELQMIGGRFICKSCGFPSRNTEDYICLSCNQIAKLSKLTDHLKEFHNHL